MRNAKNMVNMKKCPPGVICVENVTLFFLFVIILIVGYLIYINLSPNSNPNFNPNSNNSKQNTIINERIVINPGQNQSMFGMFTRPNYGYTNLPGDVLLNPYTPPLRDERYQVPDINYIPPNSIPINISTNIGAVNTNYRQVGILTPLNGPNKILPLMGRPLFTNRDKWQYYTLSEPNNIKLPVVKNGKSCTNEYGCDNLYNGDTIYVEGYNDAFKVTVYDNDTIRYIPQI